MRATLAIGLLAVCAAAAAASAQQVWVVDPAGAPGTVPTLAVAVDAAAPGDVVLVQHASGLAQSWDLTLG